MKRCGASLKRRRVSLQVGVAFGDVRNKDSSVEHAVMAATLSPSSIDNRNLNIFPYKLNFFTNLVYKQIVAALICSASLQC